MRLRLRLSEGQSKCNEFALSLRCKEFSALNYLKLVIIFFLESIVGNQIYKKGHILSSDLISVKNCPCGMWSAPYRMHTKQFPAPTALVHYSQLSILFPFARFY